MRMTPVEQLDQAVLRVYGGETVLFVFRHFAEGLSFFLKREAEFSGRGVLRSMVLGSLLLTLKNDGILQVITEAQLPSLEGWSKCGLEFAVWIEERPERMYQLTLEGRLEALS